ncbi:MAG: RnfABCDGE type electron transport complex subunit D [Phycisphaerae bacterium]|nr:RnfABCDGE type electron transport complex subunit D [Phycisphaerae bacterium]
MIAKDRWYQADRLGGLRRFAAAITILNLLGHTLLGFEPAWAHPFVAVATAYTLELILEVLDARANNRSFRFLGGGVTGFIDFFLSAHISAMAVSMLLYANERLWPISFAAAVAIASKAILQVRCGERVRHFLNPSNFGITVTLLAFPWVGIAQPYQFTENLGHYGDWILPAVIVCSGSFLNWRFTRRLPLIVAWLGGFALQAVIRHLILGAAVVPSLAPMTGVAFLLFTFYMVTDPPTTPASRPAQIAFGLSVAATYGVLMSLHIVFGFFFALSIVTFSRGIYLWLASLASEQQPGLAGQLASNGTNPAGSAGFTPAPATALVSHSNAPSVELSNVAVAGGTD